METNLIANKELKVNVLDTSVAYLINMNAMTKEDLPYLKAEFGYIYQRDDGYIEALYKIIKGEEIFYLALQENKIMRIDFNEQLFYKTVADMQQMHPCLNEAK